MQELTGDLWDYLYEADAMCITTNPIINRFGNAVMGRGIALQATKRYPGIAKLLAEHVEDHGNHVGIIWNKPPLVSFPVKYHWRAMAEYSLIERSAEELVELTDLTGWKSVILPRPGCGNGGLPWREVKAHIEEILDDRFTVIEL